MSYVVRPEDFGALGDDSTDDTLALQAALDDVTANGGTFEGHPGAIYRITGTLTIDSCDGVSLFGNGARIRRDSPVDSGTGAYPTGVFLVPESVSNLRIRDWHLSGNQSSSDLSSGSSPLIQIGLPAVPADPAPGAIQNVWIEDNLLEGSNWACVVCHGGRGDEYVVNIENVWILNNRMLNSGSGIACYKNIRGIVVRNNVINDMSQNGCYIDTMAASDTLRPYCEPVYDVWLEGNSISNVGRNEQGAGVVVKGEVYSCSVCNNHIDGVLVDRVEGAPSSKTGYGIAIVAGAIPSSVGGGETDGPTDVIVASNIIESVSCAPAAAAVGIYVGPNHMRVDVRDNIIRDVSVPNGNVATGIFVARGSKTRVLSNLLENAWTFAAIRVEGATVNSVMVNAEFVQVANNTIRKAGAIGNIGIYANNVSDFTLGENSTDTTTETSISNFSEVRGVLHGSASWNPASINNGAQATTTVTVTGAAVGDAVAMASNLNLGGLQLSGEATSANTVTAKLFNATGAAVDLGAMTLYATVRAR